MPSAPDPRQAPFVAFRGSVEAGWVDYNGHMNDVYYAVVCGEAGQSFLDAVGLGAPYRQATGCTAYTVESRIRYLREATRGETLLAETLLVDTDPKRVRLRHSLRNGAGAEIATAEYLYLHVDQRSGRVAPMPADRHAVLTAVLAAHASLV
jgi:acyl-CoA thioesterase FadM